MPRGHGKGGGQSNYAGYGCGANNGEIIQVDHRVGYMRGESRFGTST